MRAPDAQFLDDLRQVTQQEIMWDAGEGSAGGYAIYSIDPPAVPAIRAVAKKYNMRCQYFRAQRAVWISRKGASFDREAT